MAFRNSAQFAFSRRPRFSRGWLFASLIASLGVAAAGCAQRAAKADSKPADPRFAAVETALTAAKAKWKAEQRDEARGIVADARRTAGDHLYLGTQVALLDAAFCVYDGDVTAGVRAVVDRIVATPPKYAFLEANLHDSMIFLRELQGDPAGALVEAIAMGAAMDRLTVPADRDRARLGALWQRAHTLRAFAETLSGSPRDAALLYAQRARDEFAAQAKMMNQSLASITILDEQFATLDHDGPRALALARSLDLSSLDFQDLYITARAFEAGGDAAAAERARDLIRSSSDIGLFHAAYLRLIQPTDQRGLR